MSESAVQLTELCLQQIQAADVDAISDFLEEYGAHAITLTDAEDCPVLEPAPGETPLWPMVQLRAIFDSLEMLLICEKMLFSLYPDLDISHQAIKEQPWDSLLAQKAKPLCFGKRLWVCPSHLSVEDKQAVTITLDPGLAFGTGTHPTTSLCLRWLDKNIPTDKTIVDYGCGSGILMIAALKLGAKYAYGIDLDSQALIATQNNAIINALSPSQYQLSGVDNLTIKEPVDFLLANILLNPLISLKNKFQDLLSKSGVLVVSGILTTQMQQLIDNYHPHFKLIEHETLEEWSLLVFILEK